MAAVERGTFAYGGADRLTRAGAPELRDQMIAFVAASAVSPNNELPDRWMEVDTVIDLQSRRIHVVATPGHTAGHVVFYDDAESLLFAGDHVLPHITPSIGLESNPALMPLADYLASLALVRARPDATLLPAHGPVATSVHARVDELLKHHDRRLDATVAAVREGADTGFDVAKILRWTRRERRLEELDIFNAALAVAETLAHLDVLVTRGQVTLIHDAAGVDHFMV
jgi:glyoxylase-like metal-dependent hydrolase (beta-lactamase superfamily II)